MKKTLVVLILALICGSALLGQEIKNFTARQINKRYEISFEAPASDDWNPRFDIFLFGREENGSQWFKLEALQGDYSQIKKTGLILNNCTILWEPVLDFHPLTKYSFRVFAVNTKYVPADYSYLNAKEIGLLNLWSELDGVSYHINGESASFSLPVPLPVGEYQAAIMQGNKTRNQKSVLIKPMQLTEVNLTPREGYLTLTANEEGVVYKVNGKSYNKVERLLLKEDMYNLEAILQNAQTGAHKQTAQIMIRDKADTTYAFRFEFGRLTLTSSETYVQYIVNDKQLSSVTDLPLPAGTYTVRAVVPAGKNSLEQTLEASLRVETGKTTRHNFIFDFGLLSLEADKPDVIYNINGKVNLTDVKNLKVSPGKYHVTATYRVPFEPETKEISVAEGQVTTARFRFSLSKEGRAAERRHQYGMHFAASAAPAGYVSLIHFFDFDKEGSGELWGGTPSAENYNSVGNALAISCFRLNAMNIVVNESDNPYTVDYPQLYLGLGLLDQAVLFKSSDNQEMGYLFDWGMVSAGFTDLTRSGVFYDKFEIKAIASGQIPHNHETENNIFVSKFYSSRRTYDIWNQFQFAAEAKLQFGVRLASMNYLFLNVGARYQEEMRGKWYNKAEVENWQNDSNAQIPDPVDDESIQELRPGFEGLKFMLGIGLENDLVNKLSSAIFKS